MTHRLTFLARVWVIGSLACLMLAPATPAAERQRESPTARELWDDYPLEQEDAGAERQAPEQGEATGPAATARGADPPAQTVTQRAPERPDGGGSPAPLLLGLGAVLAAIALASLLARRRRGEEVPAGGPAVRPSPAPSTPRSTVSPPDLGRSWSAEIMWHEGADGSRFRVVAVAAQGRDETIVGESAVLRWPPASQDDIEALSRAADELSASVIDAGWHPLAPGRAWYAKRFEWSPVGRPAADESRGPRSGRFSHATDEAKASSNGGKSIGAGAGGPS